MLKDYLRLATSNLRRRRLRSWLTMIGIFIGIAAVVSLISLGQGMQNAISAQFSQLGADKLTIKAKGFSTGPPGSNSDIQLTTGDLRTVQHVRGIAVATGRLVEPISVTYNRKTIYTYVASMPSDPAERALVSEAANVGAKDMLYGRALKSDDQWKVVMSQNYYDDPKFNGKSLAPGDRIEINGQTVDVVGIFKKTGNPFVDMSFAMNEQQIRDLLDIPDKYGLIVAQVAKGSDVQLVAESVTKDLRNYRNVKEGKEDFEVQTAAQTLDTVKTVLAIVTAVLVGIAAISLLVGGIGIMNTMYTAVVERTNEIGIMKAIGARNSDVLLIFLIEAGLLGTLGGVIGILLGMGFSKLVEIIATISLGTNIIQSSFPWYLIVGSLLFSFCVGAAAGTFPAVQASKLPPVEALRQ